MQNQPRWRAVRQGKLTRLQQAGDNQPATTVNWTLEVVLEDTRQKAGKQVYKSKLGCGLMAGEESSAEQACMTIPGILTAVWQGKGGNSFHLKRTEGHQLGKKKKKKNFTCFCWNEQRDTS